MEPGSFPSASGREQLFHVSKALKCFCLTQFVGLSISYLGEMSYEWKAVNTGGWNT